MIIIEQSVYDTAMGRQWFCTEYKAAIAVVPQWLMFMLYLTDGTTIL